MGNCYSTTDKYGSLNEGKLSLVDYFSADINNMRIREHQEQMEYDASPDIVNTQSLSIVSLLRTHQPLYHSIKKETT